MHLQAIDSDDLYWTESKLTANGQWRVKRSRGVPVYSMFESTDSVALQQLLDTLKSQGLVHRDPSYVPPELPVAFRQLLGPEDDVLLQQSVSSAEAVLDLLDRMVQDNAVEPHRAAFETAIKKFDGHQTELFAGEKGGTGFNLALFKWGQHPTFRRLVETWGVFTAQHRKLLKGNSKLFKVLKEHPILQYR